jgi:D-alanine-D-alanine ligase
MVLRGGHSMEREISLATGSRVARALERLGHEVHALDIEESTTGRLVELGPEAAFICLHGIGGEDGTVQALLETLSIPYTGSEPLSSLHCTDKDLAKRTLAAGEISTPPFYTFFRRTMHDMGASEALSVAARSLGYPLAVKPAREGSGLGLSKVEGEDELFDAVYEAFSYDAKLLLERWVEGKEISVPVLEPSGETPLPLPPVEIRTRGGSYDYEAKYTPGAAEFVIPADIPEETVGIVESTVLETYRMLDCSALARVDMILEGDLPQILDVKTIPGFTETSTLPLSAEAGGLSFDELVETILESALNPPKNA